MPVKGIASREEIQRPVQNEQSRRKVRGEDRANEESRGREGDAVVRRGPREFESLPPSYNAASKKSKGRPGRGGRSPEVPAPEVPAPSDPAPSEPAAEAASPAPSSSAPAAAQPSTTAPSSSAAPAASTAKGERTRIQISIAKEKGFDSPAAASLETRRKESVEALQNEGAKPAAPAASSESANESESSFEDNFSAIMAEQSPGSSAVFQSPTQQLDQMLAEQALASIGPAKKS